MKIAIDLDDVVVDFVNGYLQMYESKYGKKFPFESITCYDFWKCLKIPKKKAFDLVNEFYDSDIFREISFIKGAKEGIYKLARKNHLYFVTARPLKIKDITNKFIKKHFSHIILDIFYSGDIFNDQGPTKADICKEKNIGVLIEDNKDCAIGCSENGTIVFLFDKPWNQNLTNLNHNMNICRVYGWKEILDKLV